MSTRKKTSGVRIESFGAKALRQLGALLVPVPSVSVSLSSQHAERFTKVSSDGKLLPRSAKDWVAVYAREQELVFARRCLPKKFGFSDAMKAAQDTTLCGMNGWRAPTLMERFRICDHSRTNPALPVDFFDAEDDWEWTSTVDAGDPSDFAWVVGLGNGGANGPRQCLHCRVRAVRASQSFDFWRPKA